MARKTSLFLLNKVNYFYLHWFIAEKKLVKQQRKRKDVFLNWSHPNLRCPNFDFHIIHTVGAVDLYIVVIVTAAAVVVPVVVAVGKDMEE